MENLSFGNWLKRRRRGLGLTQNELARRAGYSGETLRKVEADALRPSRQMAERLADQLGLSPDERPAFVRFARDEPEGDTALTPFPSGLPRRRSNLPIQLTSFIGRERDIDTVKRLLATTRLLTLTGVGGTGKTRLALQVAAEYVDQYSDGVWLVELAALADAAIVPRAVAAIFGLRDQPGRSTVEILLDYLRSKSVLVVLDNCEHLIDACAQLADNLLRACPHAKILATSREGLGIAGEVIWAVPSLPVPDVRQGMDKEAISTSEAVRLFLERAQATNPELVLTDHNARMVARLCQRLDGIPLAIELAAARANAMSVEQIATRLDDRFRLLTGGSRTALARHQTLRAAVDWSYQLLSGPERLLLQRLPEFSGGWSLEAAEQVCSGNGLDAGDVLDLLAHLVSKSLVIMSFDHADGPRYRLLETIREFALERLVASSEFESVHRQHMEFFRSLAQESPQLVGPLREVGLETLHAEQDNFRAAFQWARESQDALAGLQLAGALWLFWYSLGNLAEGRGWLESALAQAATLNAPTARARVLLAAGNFAWIQNDYSKSRALEEEALVICRELGPSGWRELAYALLWLGMVEREEGNLTKALSLHEESVTICRVASDAGTLAFSLVVLGRTLAAAKELATARSTLEEGRTIFRGLGDKYGEALALNNLGLASFRAGDDLRALALYQESIALFSQVKERVLTIRCLEELAWVNCRLGRYGKAACLFGAVQAQREAFGVSMPPALSGEHDEYVGAARSKLNAAVFSAAWDEGRAMTMEQAIGYAEDDEPTRLVSNHG